MKLLLFFLIASLSFAKPSIDVYILAGQSNAVGAGGEVPEEYLRENDLNLIVVGGTTRLDLRNVQPGCGHEGRLFGTELSFSKSLPRFSLIIKYALSGTSLGRDWKPGSPLRIDFELFVKDALLAISERFDPTLRGMVWIQGESDAWSGSEGLALSYRKNLERFVEDNRKKFGPFAFVFSEVQQKYESMTYVQLVNDAQHSAVIPHSSIVSTNGLTTIDTLHYDSVSNILLGRRLAKAMLSLTEKAPLVNLSVLGKAGTSVGFVVSASSAKVLVRGVGPSLRTFGVTGFVTNPILQIFDNTGKLVAQNDDWTSEDSEIFREVGAFFLTDPLDSAIMLELSEGAYTAKIMGEGTGLIEVYLRK